MKPVRIGVVVLGLGLLAALAPTTADAQVATIRGKILDTEGNPIPDVAIRMEYRGENRNVKPKEMTSDKNGGYIMGGLKDGLWYLLYTKEGYRTYERETYISLGGISEMPDLTLSTAPIVQQAAPTPEPIPTPTVGEELEKDYRKAMTAVQEGDDATGEQVLKSMLEKAPDAAIIHYQLGMIYLARQDYVPAEASLQKARELAPEVADSYIALSALMGTQDRNEEALDMLLSKVDSFPGDSRYHFQLAILAMNAARDAEARTAFEKVAELDPKHAETQYHLGTLAMNRSDIPVCIAHLERYLELAPEGPNAEVAKALIEALKK